MLQIMLLHAHAASHYLQWNHSPIIKLTHQSEVGHSGVDHCAHGGCLRAQLLWFWAIPNLSPSFTSSCATSSGHWSWKLVTDHVSSFKWLVAESKSNSGKGWGRCGFNKTRWIENLWRPTRSSIQAIEKIL